jgi:hypothetical protein
MITGLVLAFVMEAANCGEVSAVPPVSGSAAATAPARPALPKHERIVILQFESKDGKITLAARSEAAGRMKPAPAPAGRTGLYFKALDAAGGLICDGMLPDPYIVRAPAPPPGGQGTSPAPSFPVAERDETSFLVRLPAVAGLQALELYRVPAGTAPGAARDAVEFRMGTFDLTKK